MFDLIHCSGIKLVHASKEPNTKRIITLALIHLKVITKRPDKGYICMFVYVDAYTYTGKRGTEIWIETEVYTISF